MRWLKRGLLVFIALVALYSLVWTAWGVYLKRNLTNLMASNPSYNITSQKIELSGYPFALSFHFHDFSLQSKSQDKPMQVNIPNLVAHLDLRLRHLVLELKDNIVIIPGDNKQNYRVGFKQPAFVEMVFNNICLTEFLSLERKAAFSDFRSFRYHDQGFDLEDLVLEKTIITSKPANIDLAISNGDREEQVHAIITLALEPANEENVGEFPKTELNTDFVVKLFNSAGKDKNLEGFAVDIAKFIANLSDSELSLQGKLDVMNSKEESEGMVEFKISNFPNFMNLVAAKFGDEKAAYVKRILYRMSGTEIDAPLENFSIQIKNSDKTIKFGEATMIDLILYSIQGMH